MQARSYQDKLCTKNSNTLEHSTSKYPNSPNSEDLQKQTQTLGAEDSPHLGGQKIYLLQSNLFISIYIFATPRLIGWLLLR